MPFLAWSVHHFLCCGRVTALQQSATHCCGAEQQHPHCIEEHDTQLPLGLERQTTLKPIVCNKHLSHQTDGDGVYQLANPYSKTCMHVLGQAAQKLSQTLQATLISTLALYRTPVQHMAATHTESTWNRSNYSRARQAQPSRSCTK